MITLFQLLTTDEYHKVKEFTDVRNSELNDLTVKELFDLHKFIIGNNKITFSKSVESLIVLEQRELVYIPEVKNCECIWRCHCDL